MFRKGLPAPPGFHTAPVFRGSPPCCLLPRFPHNCRQFPKSPDPYQTHFPYQKTLQPLVPALYPRTLFPLPFPLFHSLYTSHLLPPSTDDSLPKARIRAAHTKAFLIFSFVSSSSVRSSLPPYLQFFTSAAFDKKRDLWHLLPKVSFFLAGKCATMTQYGFIPISAPGNVDCTF